MAAKEITATDNWQASFTDLPVYKEGKKITYTITEDPVVGYTTTIDGFTVTNRHTPQQHHRPLHQVHRQVHRQPLPNNTSYNTAKQAGKTRNSNHTKRRKEKILPSTGEVVAYGLTILGALLAVFALALLLRGKRKEK